MTAEFKGCIDQALHCEQGDETLLVLSGWLASRHGKIVLLEIGVPGYACVVAARKERDDMAWRLSAVGSQDVYGFEAALPLNKGEAAPGEVLFIAHLESGAEISASMQVGTVQRAAGCMPGPSELVLGDYLSTQFVCFMEGRHELRFPTLQRPVFSVVVVADQRAELLYFSLRELQRSAGEWLQIFVLLRRSDAAMRRFLQKLHGVTVIDISEKPRYVPAELEPPLSGEFILLLRAGTALWPSSFEAARTAMGRQESLEAVCGRVLGTDGRLVEAGGTLLEQGGRYFYGTGADPHSGEYLFSRDVDCAHLSPLFVRRAVFAKLPAINLSSRAVGELALELCACAKAAGGRVLYHPEVMGMLSSGIAREEAVMDVLTGQEAGLFARSSERAAHRLLCLAVPDHDFAPAWGRQFEALGSVFEKLSRSGTFVTLWLYGAGPDLCHEFRARLPMQVEVLAEQSAEALSSGLQARESYYDAALVWQKESLHKLALAWPQMWAGKKIIVVEPESAALTAPGSANADLVSAQADLFTAALNSALKPAAGDKA